MILIKKTNLIPVTKTYLPSQDVYQAILKKAWDNNWITNRGELVVELEKKLSNRLNVNHLFLTTNGTLPIQIAIKAFDLKGEIITTPFSYVATTSSIVWENCTPIFVDIHSEYLTIDETKIEAAITKSTSAILATHVFGNPCNVDVIERIAAKHKLKVIYDAAHCFDVTYKDKSIFSFGDISTCSFHATKLFHTGEGGAIFCNDKELFHQLFYHHNFGHNGPEKFHGLGINAKMSELQAAMGLAVLPEMENIISRRKSIVDLYIAELKQLPLHFLQIRPHTEWNYSYFPVVFESEDKLLEVMKKLNDNGIFPRRYFYPSLNTLAYVSLQSAPISENIASKILCLPLYFQLTDKEQKLVIKTLKESL